MIGNRTALATAIVLFAALASVHAAFPGGNGEVVFESNRAGGFDLYTVEADGTGTAVLVATTGADRAPAWSPDGSRVAFQSNLRGNFDTWIVNADGSGLRAPTSDAANEIQPAWSPDGQTLAFVTDRFTTRLASLDIGNYRLDRMDFPGGEIRPLPDFPESNNHNEEELARQSTHIITRRMHHRHKYCCNGSEVEVVRPLHNTEFCAFCNRLRLTSDGMLKPWLLRADNHLNIRGSEGDELRSLFTEAVRRRAPYYQ